MKLWTGFAAIRRDVDGTEYADVSTLTRTADSSERLAMRADSTASRGKRPATVDANGRLLHPTQTWRIAAVTIQEARA